MSRIIYENDIPEGFLCRLNEEERKRYLIWQYFFVPSSRENASLWVNLIDFLFESKERPYDVDVIQLEYIEDLQEKKSNVMSREFQAEAILRVNGSDVYRVCYPLSNGSKNCLYIFKVSAEYMRGKREGFLGALEHRTLVLEAKRENVQENEVYLSDCMHETLCSKRLEGFMPLFMTILYYDSDEERKRDRAFWSTYIKEGLENLIKGKEHGIELYLARKIIIVWNDICKEVFIKDFRLLQEIQNIFMPYVQCEKGILESQIRDELEMKYFVLYMQKREDIIRNAIRCEVDSGTEMGICTQKLQRIFGLSEEDALDRIGQYDLQKR